MDVHTVFSFLISKAHNAPTVPEQLCKISSATPQWWWGQKRNKTAVWTERQGWFSFAGRGASSACVAKECETLADRRETSGMNPRGENCCLSGGETGEQSQAEQESHSCFKISRSTGVHIPSNRNACSNKKRKQMYMNKARVTNPKCSIFFG